MIVSDVDLGRPDGTRTHTTEVARALAREGFAVDLVSRGPDPCLPGVRYWSAGPDDPSRLQRISAVNGRAALVLLRRRRRARALYVREDWGSLPTVLIARLLGYRVVAEVNDVQYGPGYPYGAAGAARRRDRPRQARLRRRHVPRLAPGRDRHRDDPRPAAADVQPAGRSLRRAPQRRQPGHARAHAARAGARAQRARPGQPLRALRRRVPAVGRLRHDAGRVRRRRRRAAVGAADPGRRRRPARRGRRADRAPRPRTGRCSARATWATAPT